MRNSPEPVPTSHISVAQAHVDEEIAKHLSLVYNLRERRNTFSPIFRLPSEVLAIIFIHGAHSHYVQNKRRTLRRPHWVNVSYVCRHWRNVALECPSLWAYHFIVSPRWTEELLARSKQASLKIRIFRLKMYKPWLLDVMGKLLKLVGRAQDFRLHHIALSLPTEFSLQAPCLQHLEIKAYEGFSSDRAPTLFGGDTPALRTLKLSDCQVPWRSLTLSGLTTLFLRRVGPRLQPNMVELRTVLGRMQNLTALYLEDALPSARDFLRNQGSHTSSRVRLSHLTRLSVAAPLSTVLALLSCVIVPPKTQVRLGFQFEPGLSIDDYAQIPRLVAERFNISDPASSGLSIRSLTIDSNSTSRGLKFIFSTRERDYNTRFSIRSPEKWDRDIPLGVIIDIDQSMTVSDRCRIINDVYSSIPSTNIQSLCVLNPPFSPAFWTKILAHFQGLRYLKLGRGCMPDLVSVLSSTSTVHEPTDTQATNEDSANHVGAPALEELQLSYITFSLGSALPGIAISQSSLEDALSTRPALQERFFMTYCMVVG